MDIRFQELTDEGLTKVRDIYNFYILNTTSTFHTEKISLEELNESIYINHPRYKSFLIAREEKVLGFCYLTHYKKRPAYNRTAELSIYLRPECKGKGYGRRALDFLEEQARNVEIRVLMAIITQENDVSIKLFENCGYEKCGHFKQVGEKFNKLLDVVAYQKFI